MAIEAFCPNGHKILCPDDRAGRMAKCPRCGAPFRIPGGDALLPPGTTPAGGTETSAAAAQVADAAMPAVTTPNMPGDVASATAGEAPEGSGIQTNVMAATTPVPPAAGEAAGPELVEAELLPPSAAAGSVPTVTTSVANPTGQQVELNATGTRGGAAGPAPTPLSDLIIFLCPNGHKLNGPKRLAGKIGQCPHCGARFEIPIPHEGEEEEDHDGLADTVTEDPLDDFGDATPAGTAAESVEGEAAEGETEEAIDESPDQVGDEPDELASLFEAVRADQETATISRITGRSGKGSGKGKQTAQPSDTVVPTGTDASRLEVHPLAELVTRLWSEREHGGVIELYLEGGVVLAPDWFDAKRSQKSHGLFAAQAADGTVTMTVVPWDEVTRVVVRGVVGLPDGMFE